MKKAASEEKTTDPTEEARHGLTGPGPSPAGVTTMIDASQIEEMEMHEGGFTLIEVLISILITLIVMGAVFGLLTRGQKSFRREPEIADLQQSARAALDMVSKDILQAGAGLPPEFPAFSRINGGDSAPTDRLEIIGQFQSAGSVYLDPEEIQGIDAGGNIILTSNTTNFDTVYPYNMVVVYNNVPNDDLATGPRWAMALVTNVDQNGPNAVVTLDYGAFDANYSFGGVPDNVTYARDETRGIIPKITRVSVVRYRTQTDDPALYSGQPPEVLMRWVDNGINGQQPQAVGYLDDFQIAYTIGVTAPVEQDNPPDPRDLGGAALTAENMLSSVRVTVTARSVSTEMEGSSAGASGDLIRKTFSTNVNPRNISAGVDARVMAATGP